MDMRRSKELVAGNHLSRGFVVSNPRLSSRYPGGLIDSRRLEKRLFDILRGQGLGLGATPLPI